jgi:hypothetical protein
MSNTLNVKSNQKGDNLFLLIGANRLSYFTATPQRVITSYGVQTINDLAAVTLPHEDFHAVKVAFSNSLTTLVPNAVFSSKETVTYLEKSFRIPYNHYLLTNELLPLRCQNIYATPIPIYNLLQDAYNQVEYFHVATLLLSVWQEQAVNFQKKTVFVNVYTNYFQVGVFEREKLFLFNTYEYKASKDFLYFVLLVFDQLKLDPEQVPLFLSGDIMQQSEICNLLYRYIKTVTFLKRTTAYTFTKELDELPQHFNYDLFAFYTV